MKHAIALLAWAALACFGVLAALNAPVLMAQAPLNLVFAQVQAPLGLVLLGLAGVLAALFYLAHLRSRLGSMLETRQLVRELRRAQERAGQAETSRLEELQRLMSTEFRRLHERLEAARAVDAPAPAAPSMPAGRADPDAPEPFRPLSLTEIVTGRERPRGR